MTDIPFSAYNKVLTVALESARQISDMQFRLGWLAVVAQEEWPAEFGSVRQFADEINVHSGTLNEYMNVYRFWRTDDLPHGLKSRVDELHELREHNVLMYTHFRNARTKAKQQKLVTRAAEIVYAIEWLEAKADGATKHSQMDAEMATGDDFQKMSIAWDSAKLERLAALDISQAVIQQVREIRQDGMDVRVVVYAVAADE